MLEALSSIVSAIGAVFSFIISTFQSLFAFFSLVDRSVHYLAAIWVFLPVPLVAFAAAGIAVAVVLRLIGR